MRNEGQWKATKYRAVPGGLTVGPEVGPGSRLAAGLTARAYGTHLSTYARGRLGDLGCGEVPLYEAYRDLVDRSICLDWPGTKRVLSHVEIECDLSDPLPLVDGSLETVVLSDVLEHVPEPSALWRELGRVITPGGNVLLNVPFFYWLHEQPHDYYRYTSHALRRFAETNGFDVVHLEPLGGSVEVAVDFVAKHLSVVPVAGNPLAWIVQTAALWWSASPPGRFVLRVTGDRFPLAYFMVARRRG